MTTDFKASQVQTSKVIVTGSFAGGSANQLLVYSIDADDSGTPNQGVIDTAVFDTASGIGSDVFLFVSGSTSSRGAAGSYGASVIGGDLHVSGNLTVGGTSPSGGGGGNDYWKSTTAGQIFATGTLAAITGTLQASFLSSSNGLSITGTFTHGTSTSAVGINSHAQGDSSTANGNASHAEGIGTNSYGAGSHAEGNTTIAGGDYSHAEGQSTNSSAPYSHAEGYGANMGSGASWSHVEGYSSEAYGVASHAEGFETFAGWSNTHYYSHTEGYRTRAASDYSHAEGKETKAYADGSHVEGKDTTAGVYGYSIVSIDTVTEAPFAIYEIEHTPFSTDLTTEFATSDFTTDQGGRYQVASSNYLGGSSTYITASDAYGIGSYLGNSTIAVITENRNLFPAFPQGPRILGISSHAEGTGSISLGEYSHAEGAYSKALGSGSHSEGYGSISQGDYSHSEGQFTTSSGFASHAEGYETIATGSYSHAEGLLSNASGDYSHAEGRGTQAIGEGSHAEGYVTWAIGPWSHAGGLGTFASGAYQTVVGKYNISQNDTSLFVIGDGIFVIGDGPNSSNRSDIVRVNSGTLPGSGSFEVTGTVRSTLGFSGSLTQLTDGTPYLIAGTGIQTSTGSNGAVTISTAGTSGLVTGKQYVAPYTTTTSTTPVAAGQFSWVPADYTGLTSVTVRAIMSTDGTANHTGSLQLYNLTSGSYLDLLDTPASSKHFIITSSIPTLVTSSNLLTGITNFDNSSTSVYEVRVSGSLASSTFVGGVELVFG